MTDALAAHLQMAFSLGFHIIFAEISVALPVMGLSRSGGGCEPAMLCISTSRSGGPRVGDPVRGRRSLWNGSFLRAGVAVASLHGACRAADRKASQGSPCVIVLPPKR